jgi:hypothetical protein
MTISRLLTLQALLACGLGAIFFIPRHAAMQPCRVKMELPDVLDGLVGKPGQITEQEHEILAGDTEFCRKVYDDGFGEKVLVSIVLSGHELDNSIHRPERCLRAQGWTAVDSSSLSLPVSAAPGGELPVTRLHNMMQWPTKSGGIVQIHNLNYYWFVGYSDITASHFEREYIDMRDRLLHGYDQRWAYVTVAADITKGLLPDGGGKDEAQTDAMLRKIITDVYPLIVMDKGAGSPGQ